MIYFADLHIHSKYSRATSPECNLVELARWAALKGLRVIATGDFTHPEWSREITEMLREDGDGLLRLKDEYVPETVDLPGGFGPADVRFMLNVEISSIYKKRGKTRKVHNLIFMPDTESMDRFRGRLDRIGNIKSDGRPILGLDSRDLLEIALETSDDAFLIPAHVWTPWFSILGSKSGFDSVEECFDDLSSHIFALETGLSSDPEMNHQVGSLDRYTLVSNSDTHSPAKLGREANILVGTPGYREIREAIRSGGAAFRIEGHSLDGMDSAEFALRAADISTGFVGTVEFFPEEGKYHLDGHRKCSQRMEPHETEAQDGTCPVCGNPVTVGVMNRVMELADREAGEFPERAAPFWRMLPLVEIVAQTLEVGPQSKRVAAAYTEILKRLGPELHILWTMPLDDIDSAAPEILVEAIRRVRKGEISIDAGFDGEYGKVQLFSPGEHELLAGQQSWIDLGVTPRARSKKRGSTRKKRKKSPKSPATDGDDQSHHGVNEEQREAVETWERPVLVQAGPGTGKTRTLTHRVATLIQSGRAQPDEITSVTFTRKAAEEMRERLQSILPQDIAHGCWVGTFHQLGMRLLDVLRDKVPGLNRTNVLEEDDALALFRQAVRDADLDVAPSRVPALFARVSLLKQNLAAPTDAIPNTEAAQAYQAYESLLERDEVLDLDDLLVQPVTVLHAHPDEANILAMGIAKHLLIDEFQDVNRAQYEMVRILSGHDGEGLFAIGDPDQAIYGFRGADRNFFFQIPKDYPRTRPVSLTRNYRSQETVLKAAGHVMDGHGNAPVLSAQRSAGPPIRVVTLPNATLEAKFIVRAIDGLLGGASFLSIDSGTDTRMERQLGFHDIAVLFRLNAVGDALEEEFRSSGIPYQRARRSDPREEAEGFDPRAEAVTLMTIHAAKGLEFSVVFVAGCEDGIIPYVPEDEGTSRAADLEEERRLLYVAMTRASNELFLTRSSKRSLFGKHGDRKASRFLLGLDPSLCDYGNPLTARRTRKEAGPQQCELFSHYG